ncbi:MAG: ABC transporter permease, partial [Longimicrobiales bacterium]
MTGRSWIRVLLRLYSPSFRRRYGAEAVEVVEADLAAAGAAGSVARAVRVLAVLGAFAVHGLLDRVSGGARAAGVVAGLGGWTGPGWGHDARAALRGVLRRPVFGGVAVASLAVGIAANTTAFALVDALLLREIAGASDHDRIVELSLSRRGSDGGQWDWPTFIDTRDGTPSLASMALAQPGPVSLVDDAAVPDRLMALYVTSAYFETLGVALARGRPFGPEVDVPGRTTDVVVLSHALWQTRFGADPDVLGRTVRINREPYTVVGVTPAAFRGHRFGARPAVYLPLTRYPAARADPERFFGARTTGWAEGIGRLTPEATVEGLQAALGAGTERVARATPDDPEPPVARAAVARPVPAEARAPIA